VSFNPTITPQTAADIRRGVTGLGRRLRAERAPGGLSVTKLGVLSHLRVNGASSPGEIAAAEHHQPQSLTRVLTDLHAAGLITRSPNTNDRRGSIVCITERGRRALAHDMAQRDTWLLSALGELSAAEVGLLRVAGDLMSQIASYGPHHGAVSPPEQHRISQEAEHA